MDGFCFYSWTKKKKIKIGKYVIYLHKNEIAFVCRHSLQQSVRFTKAKPFISITFLFRTCIKLSFLHHFIFLCHVLLGFSVSIFKRKHYKFWHFKSIQRKINWPLEIPAASKCHGLNNKAKQKPKLEHIRNHWRQQFVSFAFDFIALT